MTKYTKEELIHMVEKICSASITEEEEEDFLLNELQRVFPCAAIGDLIFWDNKTPKEVIEAAMSAKPIIL